MRQLVGRGAKGDKGAGTATTQGVPGVPVGRGDGIDDARELGGSGTRMLGQELGEEGEPGVDKGGAGAPAGGTLVLGCSNSNEPGEEVGGAKSGGLGDAEQGQEGHKQEAILPSAGVIKAKVGEKRAGRGNQSRRGGGASRSMEVTASQGRAGGKEFQEPSRWRV